MSELTSTAQLVGFVSLLATLAGFQLRNPRHTLLVHVVAEWAFALHTFLLGSPTAALQLIGSGVRNLILGFAGNQWNALVGGFYLTFSYLVAAMMATGPMDILPALATTFGTVGALYRDHPAIYRVLSLACLLIWLTFSVLIGSLAGTIEASVVIGGLLIAMYRFHSPSPVMKTGANGAGAPHHRLTEAVRAWR